MSEERIFLSPPHLTGEESSYLEDALGSGWVAPLGPHVDAFEDEFAEAVARDHAVALSSGTAALHLALRLAGVGPGDLVLVPSFTFVATANPVRYLGAEPVFVDSERTSWNMDPERVEEALRGLEAQGRRPAAVIVVHLYGQTADCQPILKLCRDREIPLIEDAAEALGASYRGQPAGSIGFASAFSFNGNKILTTSGGGMLVTDDPVVAKHARRLATQARDPAPYYQHSELGYNYRMSNLLASVGRAQLKTLEERVQSRRAIFERYSEAFSSIAGWSMQPEAPWGRHTRWLTCTLVSEETLGVGPEAIRQALERRNIEARPLWKPMHLQPLYAGSQMFGGSVCEGLFRAGLCLPSGSGMTPSEQERVIDAVTAVLA